MGNFNNKCDSWYSDHSNSELGLSLLNLVDRNGPTRTSDKSQSLLDLILTDSPHIFSNNLEIKLPRSFRRHGIVWDLKNGNFAAFNSSLRLLFTWHMNCLIMFLMSSHFGLSYTNPQ